MALGGSSTLYYLDYETRSTDVEETRRNGRK